MDPEKLQGPVKGKGRGARTVVTLPLCESSCPLLAARERCHNQEARAASGGEAKEMNFGNAHAERMQCC